MSQNQKFQGVKTSTVRNADGSLSGFYRGTEVCRKLPDSFVVLKCGGYLTATTKMRMNQFSAEFCNDRFRVYQKSGLWYVEADGQTREFFEGMAV